MDINAGGSSGADRCEVIDAMQLQQCKGCWALLFTVMPFIISCKPACHTAQVCGVCAVRCAVPLCRVTML
jgi:hypothetical protein